MIFTYDSPFFIPFFYFIQSLASAAAILLLDFLNLGRFHILGGHPASGGHVLIDIALNGQGICQSSVKGGVHIGGAGRFDGAVHIQVAHTLGGKQNILHYCFIIHRLFSFHFSNKTVEGREGLAMLLCHVAQYRLQFGVSDLTCRCVALFLQKLGVLQSVFNIK